MGARPIEPGTVYANYTVLGFTGESRGGKRKERIYHVRCTCGAVSKKSSGYLSQKALKDTKHCEACITTIDRIPPIEPGTVYANWIVLGFTGEMRNVHWRIYRVRCTGCGTVAKRTSAGLNNSVVQRHRGCKVCHTRRSAEAEAREEGKRAARILDQRNLIWTGEKHVRPYQAARDLGVSRQRIHQLTSAGIHDLSDRYRKKHAHTSDR